MTEFVGAESAEDLTSLEDGHANRAPDPRESLAAWANERDEWLRYIVRRVLSTGRKLTVEDAEHAYLLFRQEKSLDNRVLPTEPSIETEAGSDDAELPLMISKISEVMGVNALVPGSVIEPHAGLTILFGENGTGKTGYSRILKALADSRTADVVLGNVDLGSRESQSARIAYRLGGESKEFVWTGERGHAPFTRMSIFDSPSVHFHVDDELEYVYVPSVLALFNHAIAGIKTVGVSIEAAVASLTAGGSTLLGRFPRDSAVYPLIETLGASTDLEDLRSRADSDPKVDVRIEVLRKAIAALDANTIGAQITIRSRAERVLRQATLCVRSLESFDLVAFNKGIAERAVLQSQYQAFRDELFAAADLPAEPEETWGEFVATGENYKKHLESVDAHDVQRCLYCRQPLSASASALIGKYGEYLADKINQDIEAICSQLRDYAKPIVAIEIGEVASLTQEYEERDDRPEYYDSLTVLESLVTLGKETVSSETSLPGDTFANVPSLKISLEASLLSATSELADLRTQAANRSSALAEKKVELRELVAASELSKSWSVIEQQVKNAKEADKLRILGRPIPMLTRAVTELSKTASDQLMNQNFDKLFAEECAALRAPSLKLEFIGRQGRAHRRKAVSGKHKPSKVLSEGEQKVLAMADFLAEARLAGISAPVIFDDPVSSLDHRRINEVAQRVALLAEAHQVIVFTHDIFFATTLLLLLEKSKRCTYYQITDDEGKGKVARATGPRWDTLNNLKANLNKTIEAAKAVEGEARAALVREGYDWVRSWCEVFTEVELLQGVSQRYQSNIRMTVLPSIKASALPSAIAIVTRVFEDACRYIAGHSQPLVSLGVAPTLPGLEAHWAELQECRKAYLAAEA